MDEMSLYVEENSRIIFRVNYVVLEDLVVESAGSRVNRRHDFGMIVVCAAERDGRSLILFQSSLYTLLTRIAVKC